MKHLSCVIDEAGAATATSASPLAAVVNINILLQRKCTNSVCVCVCTVSVCLCACVFVSTYVAALGLMLCLGSTTKKNSLNIRGFSLSKTIKISHIENMVAEWREGNCARLRASHRLSLKNFSYGWLVGLDWHSLWHVDFVCEK